MQNPRTWKIILLILLTTSQISGAESVSITHGPILGKPGIQSMGVWARTASPAGFKVVYGTSPTTLDRTSDIVKTELRVDNTGVVTLTGLEPNTRYYYKVITENSEEGPGGSFRTLRDGEALKDPAHNPRGLFNFKFEFGCGNSQRVQSEKDRRAVFRDIGTQAWYDYLAWSNPLVHTPGIHFGIGTFKTNDDVLFDHEADFSALKLDEMSNLHVHWGGKLAGERLPTREEYEGDPNAGVYDIVEVIDKHRLRIHPEARANGQMSYSIGRRNYGKFRVANCDFYLLDTRSYREDRDLQHPAEPGVTMLGKPQLNWVIDEMKSSDADFLFVVSTVNFMIPHMIRGQDLGEPLTKGEAWTVYLDEREKLTRSLPKATTRQPASTTTAPATLTFAGLLMSWTTCQAPPGACPTIVWCKSIMYSTTRSNLARNASKPSNTPRSSFNFTTA
jgi:hypothetical protein